MAHLHATEKPIYDNWVMQAPDGTVMCRCGKDRAEWYIERGLAKLLDENVIQLTFTPNGLGNAGSEFYTAFKENKCVVCGSEKELTLHHVVPRMYRKYFPIEMKANRSIDVLILCIECHESYEHHSQERSQQLLKQYGIKKIHEQITTEVKNLLKVKSYAHTLVYKGHKIPERKQNQMLRMMSDWFGREVCREELQALMNIRVHTEVISPGEQIVAKLTDLDEFIIGWRQHFVDIMAPKHLPPGWDVSVLV